MIGTILFQSVLIVIVWKGVNSAPTLHSKAWPPMKTFDIWDVQPETKSWLPLANEIENNLSFNVYDQPEINQTRNLEKSRYSKVLNFFPVPVDDECLSDDGRRFGICLNVYECRIQGGTSRGECALGFGVCCVFIATCEQEIKNNITYIVSPNFPNFMPTNMTTCKMKVKMISKDISQLRIDFNHFLLGQPNRKTGICDGDLFSVSGGLGGTFTLCGQNSGQHVYYEVGSVAGRKESRQASNAAVVNSDLGVAVALASVANGTLSNPVGNSSSGDSLSNSGDSVNSTHASSAAEGDTIEILMSFTNRSAVSTRLWEIRVIQIPFSQRAPAGCLQYFTGLQGIIQTFNFADNGRHLANQDYRACVRQDTGMCSITYEPCDDQSFRIGPSDVIGDASIAPTTSPGGGGIPANDPANTLTRPLSDAAVSSPNPVGLQEQLAIEPDPGPISEATPLADPITQVATSPVTAAQADDPDAVEGSGGGAAPVVAAVPVRGGFDIFSFFRNAFDFDFRRSMGDGSRTGRQFYSRCTDRITMPCIVEDFIGSSIEPLLGCEPVHCGDRFCSAGNGPCKIESTVTPFRVGVHFGDGAGKGNPEDNIGACLRYNQMQCM